MKISLRFAASGLVVIAISNFRLINLGKNIREGAHYTQFCDISVL